MKTKAMLVFGTRPEAIKMAPLCNALLADEKYFETMICVTGQHREMLDQVLSVFNLTPDIDLNLMKPGQSLSDITSSILLGMSTIFKKAKPDLILVHGDTTTMLAASMAAFYVGVPVGHVEAGLRTFDINSPFPEEFNRQVVSKIAKWNFAPTVLSERNLLREDIASASIFVTGNTVIDALYWVIEKIRVDTNLKTKLISKLSSVLNFDWQNDRFVLITGHRRENFGEGFINICHAIKDLAVMSPSIHFVYPVHLNPNVQKPVMSIVGHLENVHLIGPLPYEPFVYLMNHCYFVLTDSGGIQEEAPSLGKPVLVMRDTTERPEAVSSGNVILVGSNKKQIISNVQRLFTDQAAYQGMAKALNPYGDGTSSKQIVSIIKKSFYHDN